MPEMKIKFLRDHVVQDEYAGTDRETKYLSGKTYPFSEPSAQHFLRRGIADIPGRKKPAAKAPPKPVEDSGDSPGGAPDPMKTGAG